MAELPDVIVGEEFRKNPELKESDIQLLKKWCSQQPHLPKVTDSELALFLHSNYYRIEPTKKTIESFYTMRSHMPEYFTKRDPVEDKGIRQAFSVSTILPLEEPTKEGYKVIFGKLIDDDVSKYCYTENLKAFNMSIDLWCHEQGAEDGLIFLIDMENLTFAHAAKASLSSMKKFLYYMQEALPVRLKGLHYIRSNSVMEFVLSIMRPFMKKELINMIHLHPNVESLQRHVPLEILPNELGGKAGPLMELHKAQIEKLENHRDWFAAEEIRSQVDESKRPKKESSFYNFFRLDRSSKKVDVD